MFKKCFVLILFLGLGACSSKASIDQTNPNSVVQAIFDAANSEEYSALENLCDPQGENDSDTQDICGLAESDTDFQQEFVEYFAKGKPSGDAEIKADEASVPILFGPDADQEETMVLVKRDDKWYLSSF